MSKQNLFRRLIDGLAAPVALAASAALASLLLPGVRRRVARIPVRAGRPTPTHRRRP